jgi:hypothetical protein
MDYYSQLEVWKIKAAERPDLKYPKIDLTVFPPNNIEGRGSVTFETLVYNNKETRLIPVLREYRYDTYVDIFNELHKLRLVFQEECNRVVKTGIFNSRTSIVDPFKE